MTTIASRRARSVVLLSMSIVLLQTTSSTSGVHAFVTPCFETTRAISTELGRSRPFPSSPSPALQSKVRSGSINNDQFSRSICQSNLCLSAKQDEEDDNKDSGDSKPLSKKVKGLQKVLVTKLVNFFPTLRTAVASFTVGVIFALTVIFVPVYNEVDKLSEPVTLFETILADIETGYVDDVDTKKLFETGVNAMLRSLVS